MLLNRFEVQLVPVNDGRWWSRNLLSAHRLDQIPRWSNPIEEANEITENR